VDSDDKPLLPAVIDEFTDGVTQMVPLFQSNFVGALLVLAFLLTSTVCAVSIIVAWRSPTLFHSPPINFQR